MPVLIFHFQIGAMTYNDFFENVYNDFKIKRINLVVERVAELGKKQVLIIDFF